MARSWAEAGRSDQQTREFTEALLERRGLAAYFDVVVSGDTTPFKKPSPEPCSMPALCWARLPAKIFTSGIRKMTSSRRGRQAVPCSASLYGYNEGRAVDSADCDALVSDLLSAFERAREF